MLRFGLFLTFFLLAFTQDQQQNTSSPDLVIHIFRHDARAPLHDTYAPDWYEYQLGELTTVGQREHYLVGKALLDEYPEILGQPYNLSKIYFRSSVLHRSLESAQSQLFGVYEGRGPALNQNSSYPSERAFPQFVSSRISQVNQNLTNAQAIPGGFIPIAANTTTDEGGTQLLEPTQVCFNLIDDILENVLGDESIQLWKDLEPTRKALEDLGLNNVNNPYSLGTFGDAIVCDYYDGRPLPGNIDPNSELYLNVTFARNWYFMQALWGSEQQRQLLSVPLYNYIFDYFDAKAAGETEFQFMFLSSAETNLIDLLATLNILTPECIRDNYLAELSGQEKPHPNCNYTEFASSILLEFYNNGGSPSVVFKYNNVAIPVCSEGQIQCPYSEFKDLISRSTGGYSADDYQRDCLGRTLPAFESIFQRLGDAFKAKFDGGEGDIKDIINDITGNDDDDNNDDNNNNDDDDNSIGDDIKDHIENAIDDIKDIFHRDN